uniref:Uncharacterized protein n=1 Tax=Timema douglasi TaxID=61478 RepID=A0A7R8VHT8_TIMDO|nr:unnamed protein product [Timema douglasi]
MLTCFQTASWSCVGPLSLAPEKARLHYKTREVTEVRKDKSNGNSTIAEKKQVSSKKGSSLLSKRGKASKETEVKEIPQDEEYEHWVGREHLEKQFHLSETASQVLSSLAPPGGGFWNCSRVTLFTVQCFDVWMGWLAVSCHLSTGMAGDGGTISAPLSSSPQVMGLKPLTLQATLAPSEETGWLEPNSLAPLLCKTAVRGYSPLSLTADCPHALMAPSPSVVDKAFWVRDVYFLDPDCTAKSSEGLLLWAASPLLTLNFPATAHIFDQIHDFQQFLGFLGIYCSSPASATSYVFERRLVDENGEGKRRYNMSKSNWEKLMGELIPPSPVEQDDNVNTKPKQLTWALQDAKRKSIPVVKGETKAGNMPWNDRLRARRTNRCLDPAGRVVLLNNYRERKRLVQEQLQRAPWVVPFKIALGKLFNTAMLMMNIQQQLLSP